MQPYATVPMLGFSRHYGAKVFYQNHMHSYSFQLGFPNFLNAVKPDNGI